MSKTKFTFSRDTLRKLQQQGLPEGKNQAEFRDLKESGLILIQYPSGKQMFYFSMAHRKRRYKQRIGDSNTFTVQEARAQANELRAAIYRGDRPIETRKKAEMQFSELFRLYQEANPDKKSADSDESKYSNHLAPVFATKQIGAITKAMIEQYRSKKLDVIAASTANRHVALMKAVFSFAVNDLEVVAKSPAAGIKDLPEPQKQKKHYSVDELNRFFAELKNEANTEAKAIIRFITLTGVRSSAARDLMLENYDPKLSNILVSVDKNGSGQYLSLSEKAKTIVDRQVAKYGKKGRVFRGVDMQSRMSDPSNVMKRVCKKAGIPSAGVHSLRHSYAVIALENGVSIFQLMSALNHKCIASTMVYASISNEQQRNINNDIAARLSI